MPLGNRWGARRFQPPGDPAQPLPGDFPMSLIRYPYRNERPFHDEMKQMFEKLFNEGEGDASSVVTSQWSPRVDIKEEADRFVIYADLPGVDPKDIEVNMDKGILSIR